VCPAPSIRFRAHRAASGRTRLASRIRAPFLLNHFQTATLPNPLPPQLDLLIPNGGGTRRIECFNVDRWPIRVVKQARGRWSSPTRVAASCWAPAPRTAGLDSPRLPENEWEPGHPGPRTLRAEPAFLTCLPPAGAPAHQAQRSQVLAGCQQVTPSSPHTAGHVHRFQRANEATQLPPPAGSAALPARSGGRRPRTCTPSRGGCSARGWAVRSPASDDCHRGRPSRIASTAKTVRPSSQRITSLGRARRLFR